MLAGIYDWMRQIIVFLLVTELLMRLTAEKYRKYLKLCVGLCLMFLVASPLLKKLSGLDFAELFSRAQIRAEFSPGKIAGDEAFLDGVLSEYQAAAKKQLTKLLSGLSLSVEKVEFWIQDNVIEGMNVWVKEIPATDEEKKKEKISITEIVIALDSEKEEVSDASGVAEFVARMQIADFYDMDISHINVIKEE